MFIGLTMKNTRNKSIINYYEIIIYSICFIENGNCMQ